MKTTTDKNARYTMADGTELHVGQTFEKSTTDFIKAFLAWDELGQDNSLWELWGPRSGYFYDESYSRWDGATLIALPIQDPARDPNEIPRDEVMEYMRVPEYRRIKVEWPFGIFLDGFHGPNLEYLMNRHPAEMMKLKDYLYWYGEDIRFYKA